MSANDSTMENALLVIAKDLLQASDDLAATDPAASAKFAQEAFEIGQDLGIVLDHIEDREKPNLASAPASSVAEQETAAPGKANDALPHYVRPGRTVVDEADDDLFHILERQKEVIPVRDDVNADREHARAAARSPSLTFESQPKRSGWLSWIRPREWRHAG